jgi:hypothetical protein
MPCPISAHNTTFQCVTSLARVSERLLPSPLLADGNANHLCLVAAQFARKVWPLSASFHAHACRTLHAGQFLRFHHDSMLFFLSVTFMWFNKVLIIAQQTSIAMSSIPAHDRGLDLMSTALKVKAQQLGESRGHRISPASCLVLTHSQWEPHPVSSQALPHSSSLRSG